MATNAPVIGGHSSLSDSEPQDFGGYNCLFVSEPPDVYTCLICTFVAKDCQQMDCCGKIYCRQCLAENQKQSKKCPNCRKAGNSFNDKRSDQEIKALKVECDNLDNGCQWVRELRSLEEHVNTCGYGLTPCTLNCQEDDGKTVKMLRKYLETHLKNKCPRRQHQCPHCQEMGEYKERTTLHMDSCPKVKVQCPNTPCTDSMHRCDVSIHRSLCDYEKIRCKFSDIGCQEIPFRKSLKDHEEDHAHHLPLIIDNSLVLKKDLKTLEARNNEQDTRIQTLKKRLRMESSSLPFTFRVENYQRRTEEDKLFTTGPLYRDGYKFTLLIGRNMRGDGSRGGGHGGGGITSSAFQGSTVRVFLSAAGAFGGSNFRGGSYGGGQSIWLNILVGVHLMKGEDDDSLTWPFTGSVTVELLNQLQDRYHALVTIQFKAEDAHSQRVTDSVYGIRYNWTTLNLKNIMYGGTCQYLHEDSLVFRVSAGKPWLQCTFKH